MSKLSTQYLHFLRNKPCVICGQPSEPCHDTGGGVGRKASDYTAIPMCHEHHRQEHQQGIKSFWQKQKQPRSYYAGLWVRTFYDSLQSTSTKLEVLAELADNITELT